MNDDLQYCFNILPNVSRTFAPTIRLLPIKLRIPVTIAYLLCRIADTVEDNEILTIEKKKKLLDDYANILRNQNRDALMEFKDGIKNLTIETYDEQLLFNLTHVFNVFNTFPSNIQQHISFWVVEMSLGMRQFAQSTFSNGISFLKTMKDLDDYTYFVAGTVGYLLTELFSVYSKRITPALKKKLNALAGPFGKGLQMVNIIRDMTVDFKRGQSYIPDELLKKYQLTRLNIFDQENSEKAENLFNELIQNAVIHLDKALTYVLLIPKEEKRIRLFCMLPLFWALRTLQKIQENTLALLGKNKVKISRWIIRFEILVAFVTVFSNNLTCKYYRSIRNDFLILPKQNIDC